jgi:hypothetical protein
MIRMYGPALRWTFFDIELFYGVLIQSGLLNHLLPLGMDQSTREPEDVGLHICHQISLESTNHFYFKYTSLTIAFFLFEDETKLRVLICK